MTFGNKIWHNPISSRCNAHNVWNDVHILNDRPCAKANGNQRERAASQLMCPQSRMSYHRKFKRRESGERDMICSTSVSTKPAFKSPWQCRWLTRNWMSLTLLDSIECPLCGHTLKASKELCHAQLIGALGIVEYFYLGNMQLEHDIISVSHVAAILPAGVRKRRRQAERTALTHAETGTRFNRRLTLVLRLVLRLRLGLSWDFKSKRALLPQ